MAEKLLDRNARDAILALSSSRKHIADDEAGAAVGVAEEEQVNLRVARLKFCVTSRKTSLRPSVPRSRVQGATGRGF